MGAKSRPPYPAAFRAEAVQLVHARGRSLTPGGKGPGRHHDTLRTWVKQAAIEGGKPEWPDHGGAHRAGPAAPGGAPPEGGEGVLRKAARFSRWSARPGEPVSVHRRRRRAIIRWRSPVGCWACPARGSTPGATAPVGPGPGRRRADGGDPPAPPREPGRLRQPADPRRVAGSGRRDGRKRVARSTGRPACRAATAPAGGPAPPSPTRRRRPPRTWYSGTSPPWPRTGSGWPNITYVPTGEGWLYLAAVLDAFSRRVVGWSMAAHLRTELVLEALELALAAPAARRPGWSIIRIGGARAKSIGRRNTMPERSCDGRAQEAPVGSGGAAPAAIPWSAAGGEARGPAAVLGGDPAGAVQRGRRGEAGVSPAVGARWFRDSGGMPSIRLAPLSGVPCRSRSGRRSRSCALGRTVSGRSPGGCVARRRRSRGSCGATPRPARRPAVPGHHGPMARGPTGPAPRRPRSSRGRSPCGTTSKTDSGAWSPRRTAGGWRARTCAGWGAGTAGGAPPVGYGVEPGTDRQAVAARLPG